ncbi:MAG: phospholipase D-like domain-containing protein, partial [Nocardioides sp.]
LNDNWTSSQTRRLRKELGKKPRRKSFVVICEGSCRGGKGNLHMKVYAFSQTGAATKVIMSGSSNLTDRAVSLQWNDQITFNSTPGLYDAFIPLFNQLKFDKRVATRRVTYTNGAFDALFYKDSAGASAAADAGKVTTERFAKVPPPSKDPVLIRLKNVDCKAKPGYGSGGKTVIRIIMYGWNKERGKYLADQVASMKRAGCKIAVITSVAGGEVVRKLNAARIPLKSADYDYITNLVTEEETVNFYSHLKVMTLDGTYLGKGTRTIWTGSENWSGTSFLNDELILHLTGDGIYKKYITHFRLLWKRYTHAVGVHPDYLP